jgi:hypothetical protein
MSDDEFDDIDRMYRLDRMYRIDAIDRTHIDTMICIPESYLQNSNTIRRAGNTSRNVDRHTTEEERPLVPLLTLFCQLVQIKDLTDRQTPPSKQPFMQQVLRILTRPRLKTRLIARDSRKPLLPHPAHRLLGRLDTNGRRRVCFRQLCTGFGG